MDANCFVNYSPGRFLMARLMVVLLTYIVKYYDFEPEKAFDKESLLPIRAGSVNLPPMKTKVRFRRRKPQGFSQAQKVVGWAS